LESVGFWRLEIRHSVNNRPCLVPRRRPCRVRRGSRARSATPPWGRLARHPHPPAPTGLGPNPDWLSTKLIDPGVFYRLLGVTSGRVVLRCAAPPGPNGLLTHVQRPSPGAVAL